MDVQFDYSPLQISLNQICEQINTLGYSGAAVVSDVIFRYKEYSNRIKSARDVLVVSTHGLTEAQKQNVLKNYLAATPNNLISFPLREKTDHLKLRIGELTFSHTYPWIRQLPKFEVEPYAFPRGRRMDVMLKLTPSEMQNIKIYIKNIRRWRFGTLGKFTDEGTQYGRGQLNSNRALKGGHNCTSWISTAPIGANKEILLELLGGKKSHEIGTNPGWWGSWLVATAPKDRIPFITVFTTMPLEASLATEVVTAQPFVWDYGRK